jgi:threonine/homoserine/homoserine lactone efflux protein
MFVLPLIVMLFFFSNRRVIGRISRWEVSEKKVIKLVMGILMILLGIIILVWFV